jgi:hypothetical protein
MKQNEYVIMTVADYEKISMLIDYHTRHQTENARGFLAADLEAIKNTLSIYEDISPAAENEISPYFQIRIIEEKQKRGL